jgi:2-keto-3-deoxy-L-rhamnonate aldolase RhmA
LATAARHHGDPVPLLSRAAGAGAAPSRTRPDEFVLTLWTDDPAVAARADAAGIDRVGIDVERVGKAQRQAGLGTWISTHGMESLPALRTALHRSRLFARTNPVNDGTPAELDALLGAGVEVVMLPMFSTAHEVERFTTLVDGRAEVVLLLERAAAARAIDEILAVDGVTEVHIGINDFTLDLGLPNRFLALTHAITDRVAERVLAAGRRFGIGGIGRVDAPGLPLDSDLIYAQYARLGASAALIARAFLGPDHRRVDLTAEVARARERLSGWYDRGPAELWQARDELERQASACGRW